MARKFATSIDLTKNELLNAVVQVLASAPSTPKPGQIYYDSVKKEFGYWNNVEWKYLTTGAGSPEATETVLGTVKLAGDIKGGTGAAPQVTNLHLAADTAINHKLTLVTDPTGAQDAATKNYVDGKVNGLAWKQPADLATAAALPAYTQSGTGPTGILTANANGILTVDGVATTLGMRILVQNAVEGKHNGIYEVTTEGTAGAKFILTRSIDANTVTQLQDATLIIKAGTANGDHEFNLSTNPITTIDTTALVWVEIQNGSVVAGDGTYTTRVSNKIEFKPNTTTPTAPAENAISAMARGAARLVSFAFTTKAATLTYVATHNLNTQLYSLEAQENSAGTPTGPVFLDWIPKGANEIEFKFPEMGSSVTYFVTMIG